MSLSPGTCLAAIEALNDKADRFKAKLATQRGVSECGVAMRKHLTDELWHISVALEELVSEYAMMEAHLDNKFTNGT